MALNRKLTSIQTPAGNKTSFTAGSGFRGGEIKKVQAHFSFAVDAGNAPPATGLRGDPFVVSRTSQGLYLLTVGGLTLTAGLYSLRQMLTCIAELQSATVSNLFARVNTVNEAAGTITVNVINGSTGAVADPAALGANERIHVVATFDNGAV